MTSRMQHGYLGLGSNLGDRRAQLAQGRQLLEQDRRIKLTAVSRIYQSTPVGFASRRLFLNQVVEVCWYGPVTALLNLALEIQHSARSGPEPAGAGPADYGAELFQHLCQRSISGESPGLDSPARRKLLAELIPSPSPLQLEEELAFTLQRYVLPHDTAAVNALLVYLKQQEGALREVEGPGLAAPSSRVRQYFDRPLDIDLIHFDGVHSELPEMQLPHPRAHRRAFVLLPLRELAPGLVLNGKPLEEWISALPPEQLADCKPVAEQAGA